MILPYNDAMRGIRGPILTIDGSLTQTGWALTAETGLRIQSGVLRSKSGPGWPADHRIYAIGTQLLALWPKLRRHPVHFGVEHQFFSSAPKGPGKKFGLNPETVGDLARLEGVVIFVAKSYRVDMEVYSLRAMEWRAQLGITGKDTKVRGVLEVVRRLFISGMRDQEVKQMAEDELEAIGLGMAIHYELTHGYPLRNRRIEIKTEKKERRERKKTREAKKKAAGVRTTLL